MYATDWRTLIKKKKKSQSNININKEINLADMTQIHFTCVKEQHLCVLLGVNCSFQHSIKPFIPPEVIVEGVNRTVQFMTPFILTMQCENWKKKKKYGRCHLRNYMAKTSSVYSNWYLPQKITCFDEKWLLFQYFSLKFVVFMQLLV